MINFDPSFKHLYKYLLQYVFDKPVMNSKLLPYYTSMLDDLLARAKKLPKSEGEVEDCIRRAVSGKRVIEIGCRDGTFLKFLQNHGAIVAGSTTDKYYAQAKELLGNAVLVKANAEEAGTKRELAEFKPDFLFSLNLFDAERWMDRKPPYRKLYDALGRIVSPKTRIFVVPSVDSHSVLDSEKVRKSPGVTTFRNLRKHRNGNNKQPYHHSISFRLRRR